MSPLVNRGLVWIGVVSAGAAGLDATAADDGGSSLVFSGPMSYPQPVSTPVYDVIGADLDSDGDIDVVVATYGSVTVRLNHGDGTLAAATSWEAGSGTMDVAAGDVDGDGDLDLVVVNHITDAGTIGVLLNRGVDGRGAWLGLSTVQFHSVGPGATAPRGLTLADLDGDGVLDAAVVNRVANSATILLNDGTGAFAAIVNLPVAAAPQRLVAADLNGDGDLDLATACIDPDPLGSASVLIDHGQLSFEPSVHYGAGSYPSGIIATDLDHDGDLDLAVCNFGASVTILKNLGGGSFVQGTWATLTTYANGLDTADFNGDGHPDLIVGGPGSDGNNRAEVLLNDGLGVFTTALTVVPTAKPKAVAATAVDASGRVVPLDLDGNGAPDFVTADAGPYTLSVFLNQTITYDPADLSQDGQVNGIDLAILLGWWGPTSPLFPQADLNQDGLVNGVDVAILLGQWG